MSGESNQRKRILGLGVLLIAGLCGVGYLLHAIGEYREWEANYDRAKRIVDSTTIGDTRGQVEGRMGHDLALHYHCDLGRIAEDVYLIGSSEPREAIILLMVYEKHDGKEVLIEKWGLDVDMLSDFSECEKVQH